MSTTSFFFRHFSPIATLHTLVPKQEPGNALSWRLCLPKPTSERHFDRRSLQFIGFPGRAWEPDGGVRLAVSFFVAFFVVAWAGTVIDAQEPTIAIAADATTQTPQKTLIVVAGAAGEREFGEQFQASAKRWQDFATKQGWHLVALGSSTAESKNDHDLLKQTIEKSVSMPPEAELWLVLIGHGTFAANVAKFNLVGPDVSATELSEWLKPVKAKCLIMNCSSSSGPFVTALGGRNRVVVTATRSGAEQNFSRFGTYLSEAIGSLTADVDHDQEVSLLEAFLAASSQTERFYREDARLATEHALLDDNGDRVGTSGDFFRGARPAKEPEPGKQIDGRAAARAILFSAPDVPKFTGEQLVERQRLEEQIDLLRTRKLQLTEEAFLAQLETLCIELAKIYQAARVKSDK